MIELNLSVWIQRLFFWGGGVRRKFNIQFSRAKEIRNIFFCVVLSSFAIYLDTTSENLRADLIVLQSFKEIK
jgi:hypothetical protein